MRVKEVTYAMLRVTKTYENDRAEVVVELGPRDSISDAFTTAKAECERALKKCVCTAGVR